MNKVFKIGLLVVLVLTSTLLKAQSEQGYELISPAQPTQSTDKVEVLEFFWYGCPHCYTFEPVLDKWRKEQSGKINFVRVPAVFNKRWAKHAKAFYTAEVLGVSEQLHTEFFDAIQNKKQKLESENQLAEFFSAHGVDETKFREAYNSFMVDAKMRKAKSMGPRYGVVSVPTMVINGKYKTNGPLAKGQNNMTKVMNRLIEKENNK